MYTLAIACYKSVKKVLIQLTYMFMNLSINYNEQINEHK